MDTKMDMRDNLEKYRKLELLLSFCKQFPKAHVLLCIFLWGKGGGRGWQNLAFLSVINVK